jgi:hypothetical protein
MMRPAFASTKSAAAFALLLLAILLLPVALRGRLLPPHREDYLQQGWNTFGDYPWLYRQIFEETNDIDIAFVGSSRIWLGIDTAYVQQQLSARLGRPAVVETIAWGWGGFDKFYRVMRDLLQHRRVRLLVFNDEGQSANLMDPYARRWFRFGENGGDLAGFPRRIQADYFFSSLLGLPRNLLELVRPNLPCELSAADLARLENAYFCTNAAAGLGSLALRQGYSPSPIFQEGHPPFQAFRPVTTARPGDALIYSAATKGEFVFTGPPMLVSQTHFAQKFGAFVREKTARLVMLHVPDLGDVGRPAIPEREFWPDTLRANVVMLGIPPQKFFAGLDDAEIHKLFAEESHLNQNGQEYFTRLISPALLDLYESTFKP